MTDIRRTELLTHPLSAAPDRVEAYRVELPPGQPAAFIAFYLLNGDQPLINPIG